MIWSIRSSASAENYKSVRKINAVIPADCGGDLIMKHFSFDWIKLWWNVISPANLKPVKNLLDWHNSQWY